MKNKRHTLGQGELLWLAIIVIIGLALRATAIASFNHVPESDELAYLSMALNLVNGHGIVDGMGNRAMYNVGYPLFILSPVFFVFGEDLLAVRVVNMLLGAATIVICYLVAKEAGAGKLGRLAAAAAWSLYLPSGVYGVYLLKENLMVPLMLAVIWCALRLVHQPSNNVAIFCGTLFGLLVLTGSAALSLVVVVVIALVLNPASIAQRATIAILTLSVTLAISAPWMFRNMQVLGAPVLNTNGGFNLYLGNNAAATGMYVSIADTPRGQTWNALRKMGEVEASETLKQEAIAWVKEHPTEFLKLAVKKAAYFWTPPFHDGQAEHSLAEKLVRLLWAIQFLVLTAAAIATAMIQRLRNREVAILWLALVCYTGVHMLFYVIFRYREPIMPVLAVMTGLVLESIVAAMNRSGASPLSAFNFRQRS